MITPEYYNFGQQMHWFVGVVEDRMDPNFLGRVRVRCFGIHTENRNELPTEELPWAMVMQPTNSAAQTEVGQSPTGLVDGSWVIGFFLDGSEAQQPLVIGSIGGYATRPENLSIADSEDWASYGFKDVRSGSNLQKRGFPQPPVTVRRKSRGELGVDVIEDSFTSRYPRLEEQNKQTTPRLARGIRDLNIYYDANTSLETSFQTTNKLIKEPLASKELNRVLNVPTARPGVSFSQKKSPYRAIYPFNQLWQTESGHILEYDDTPEGERIHEYHRAGTFREIHPDGALTTHIMGDSDEFVEAHKREYVKGAKYSSYARGYSLLINSNRMSGEDYDVRVCGTSNYNLTMEDGNFVIDVQNGQLDMLSASLELRGTNQLIQTAPKIETRAGNHEHRVDNEYLGDARGTYHIGGGTIKLKSGMNTSIAAGDNITQVAQHTVKIRAENNFTMPNFYAPVPLGISEAAKHGHIEMVAYDGDTRISARVVESGFFAIPDTATFTVTSALPTSLASINQQQPSPSVFDVHSKRPGSIIGQTKTGYIYFRSTVGDIVHETLTNNSIKLKAGQLGSVQARGGYINLCSTLKNINMLSRQNVFINAGLGFYTNSGIGTQIHSQTEFIARAETSFDISSSLGGAIHADASVVRIGDRTAFSPVLKSIDFITAFYKHRHYTPTGPTSSAAEGLVFDPSIAIDIQRSYTTKVFAF